MLKAVVLLNIFCGKKSGFFYYYNLLLNYKCLCFHFCSI